MSLSSYFVRLFIHSYESILHLLRARSCARDTETNRRGRVPALGEPPGRRMLSKRTSAWSGLAPGRRPNIL